MEIFTVLWITARLSVMCLQHLRDYLVGLESAVVVLVVFVVAGMVRPVVVAILVVLFDGFVLLGLAVVGLAWMTTALVLVDEVLGVGEFLGVVVMAVLHVAAQTVVLVVEALVIVVYQDALVVVLVVAALVVVVDHIALVVVVVVALVVVVYQTALVVVLVVAALVVVVVDHTALVVVLVVEALVVVYQTALVV